MGRPAINRINLASDLAKEHNMKPEEVLKFMDFIDMKIKTSMTSKEMPEILVNGLFRMIPDHRYITIILSYKYVKLLTKRIDGKLNHYNDEDFKNDFTWLMNQYIIKYRRYRESRRSPKKKKYYNDLFSQYK